MACNKVLKFKAKDLFLVKSSNIETYIGSLIRHRSFMSLDIRILMINWFSSFKFCLQYIRMKIFRKYLENVVLDLRAPLSDGMNVDRRTAPIPIA